MSEINTIAIRISFLKGVFIGCSKDLLPYKLPKAFSIVKTSK